MPTLARGARLGPYEVLSLLGSGGMGEVFRAKDTRLGRLVALKVLPSHLAASGERRARFEREARAISTLSHPHICALHDVGTQDGVDYLVMELLEGETLADRLRHGPLPAEQVLRLGAQMADALAAAHRAGIVHRDLKPGNVMLTRTGARLLDFGLARVHDGALADDALLKTGPLTGEGALLGTMPYMAPEQLQGKEVGPAADIFALGAVLYEMATGRRAFPGDDQASLIAAILRGEPPAPGPEAPLPPGLEPVVRACLAKDPAERWESAADVARLLRSLSAAGASVAVPGAAVAMPPRRRGLRIVATLLGAGTAAGLLVTAGWVAGRRAVSVRPLSPVRFELPPPAGGSFYDDLEGRTIAPSPAGDAVAFVGRDAADERRVYVRRLDAAEARPMAGTEGATSIFWSPDGRSIAFFAGEKLRRVDAASGAVVSICDVAGHGDKAGTWGSRGDILFAPVEGEGIWRVPATGGVPAAVVRPDAARGEVRTAWPLYLPDGERFLHLVRGKEAWQLVLRGVGPPRVVCEVASQAQWGGPRLLVFGRDGALLAQRFDERGARLVGEPIPLSDRLRQCPSTGAASFGASPAGLVVFQARDDASRLTWVDRSGREGGTLGAPGGYLTFSFSRDGRRLFFDRTREKLRTFDVWMRDLTIGTETRVTSAPGSEFRPLPLPDGRTIVHAATSGASPRLLARDLVTGAERPLVPGEAFQQPLDVSADGRTLLYTERSANDAWQVRTLSLSDGRPSAPLLTMVGADLARLAPDGRALAYLSAESGALEAYVTPYPGPGERVRVSPAGARLLAWGRDGHELFYLSAEGRLFAATLRTSPLTVGEPKPLFALPAKRGWLAFDVAPDGKRFLAIVPEVTAGELPLAAVVGWSPSG